jgi:hypothetical protein
VLFEAKPGYISGMQIGVLLALMSAVLFGASTPLAKMMLGNVSPWMMAGLLHLGAGLGLVAVHLSRSALRLPVIEAPLRRSDVPWLAAVVVAGGIFGPLLQSHSAEALRNNRTFGSAASGPQKRACQVSPADPRACSTRPSSLVAAGRSVGKRLHSLPRLQDDVAL